MTNKPACPLYSPQKLQAAGGKIRFTTTKNVAVTIGAEALINNARYEEQRLTVFGGYGTVALWCMGRAAEMIWTSN
ncbi:MAG: hypothetical protein ABIS18_00995 [Actinomycetota bacterium]